MFGVAKFTPTVNKIREWCNEMVKNMGLKKMKTENYSSTWIKHGFGPEAHEEPNENTKMVIN